jgi:hypothetical protein
LGIASLARDDLPAHWVPAFIAQKHDADLVDVGRQPTQRGRIRVSRLTGASSLASAELASWFTPPRYAWLAFALVGATMCIVYWWVWGKVFKNVGLTVE